jgi:8-oxo-dGTP pyrophosphatase MutT (NUDIX family)
MARLRREHSAGFIVFRVSAGRREYLVMRDRSYWSFPKGHLEEGEDELAAAHREVREEVGLTDLEVIAGFRRELRYPLRGSGVEKLSVYFPARCAGDAEFAPAEASEVRWLPPEEALPLLGFPDAQQMLRDVDAFLRTPGGDGA